MESREQLAQQAININNQIINANLPQTEEYMPIYKIGSDYISLAKEEYKKIVDVKNPDPRSLSIYAAFLNQAGDAKSALKYIEAAYNFAPNKQTIAIEYIKSLLMNDDLLKANEIAKATYEKDMSYVDAINMYALTSIYNKDFNTGEALITDTNKKVNIDQTIASAYIASNAESRLVSVLNKNLSLDKEDVDSMILLAQVYDMLGNKNQSISLLNKISELRPELKTKIDEYIKSMN